MRNQFEGFWNQASPNQLKGLGLALVLIGSAVLWRTAQTTWPGIWPTLVGIVFLIGMVIVFYAKVLPAIPRYQSLIPWTIPIFVGGALNHVVVLVNGGFMPAANYNGISGFYCPMDGASLAYLGDWVWGFLSPGDILAAVSILGIAITVMRNKQQPKPVEQP